MKRIFSFLLSLVLVLPTFAETDKQFRKLAGKIELSTELRALSNPSPDQFWSTLINSDWQLRKFDIDINKNKGAEKQAMDKLASMPRLYPEFNTFIARDRQAFADSLLYSLGLGSDDGKTALYVIDNPREMAYTALTPTGYAVCISSGLLDRKDLSSDMLNGIVVAQASHGELKHQLRYFYNEAKKERKNRIAIGMVLGLTAAATVAAAATLPSDTGNDYFYYYDDTDITVNINSNEDEAPRLPAFIYTSDQIYESDLVGFRFLEANGNGEEYIKALQILAPQIGNSSSVAEATPSISDRINFIRYISRNPGINNHQAEKDMEKVIEHEQKRLIKERAKERKNKH